MVYFLLTLSSCVTAAGALAVWMVWRWWAAIEPLAQRAWSKVAVAVCRACLAAAGVFGREAVAGTPRGQVDWRWVVTTCTVVVGWLLWEVADWWAGEKLKRSKATAEQAHRAELQKTRESHEAEIARLRQSQDDATQRAERAERAALLRVRLLVGLRGLVDTKNQRIRQGLQSPPSQVPIKRASAALSPRQHLAFILEQLAYFLHHQLPPTEGSIGQNFRVCLYVASDGILKPMDGFDLATKKHHPFTAYLKHQQHFRLDNVTEPAHAVRCLQQRALLIVPDCEADPNFLHFSAEQRMYLKSLVAYPIMDFRQASQVQVAAALVIDTDRTNHFREDDRDALELVSREFAARLTLEDAILMITHPK